MYLLDTNMCIYAIKGLYPNLTKKLFEIQPSEIFISTVTVGELEYGCTKSKWSDKNRNAVNLFLAAFTILPFEYQDAVMSGRIRAQLESVGTPIGSYDIQIAAHAMSRGLTVVTHNTKEFRRVSGLVVEDWVELSSFPGKPMTYPLKNN